jgi:hypothetical protein
MTKKERQENAAKTLKDLTERYNTLREQFIDFVNRGDTTKKEQFLEFETRFNTLLGDFIPVHSRVYAIRTQHDDKHATAFKYRNAVEISKEDKVSLNKAIDLSSGSVDYKEFLDDRVFWYESYNTVSGMVDSIKSYINNITHYLKS